MSLSNATYDTRREQAEELGDRVSAWAHAVPVRDVALALVAYSTQGLDGLLQLGDDDRERQITDWERILGNIDRVKVAEIGHALNVCGEMPRG